MMSNPVTGANYVLKGFGLLNQAGVRRFVIIPLLLNILIFTGLIVLLADQFGSFVDWLLPTLPDWLAWLTWLLWIIFGVAGFIIIFFTFTLVANLVGSPFNSYLASAVEHKLTGKKPLSDDLSFTKQAIDALMGELKKWLYFLMIAIPLLIISFIPLINFISPVLWAFFGAWMLVIEYADYPLGNNGLTFPAIRRTLKSKQVLSLGFGGGVMLASMIPLVNFLVMPVAVAGATAMKVEQFQDSAEATGNAD